MISMEENYQNQHHFPPSTISTNTSSLSCVFRLNPHQDQRATHEEYHLLHHHQHQQQEINDLMPVGGTRSHPVLNQTNGDHFQQIKDEYAQGSTKWMSSKMRLMRKMLGTDQIFINKQRSQFLQDQTQLNQASSSITSSNEIIRVCSNCKTTKTPLWRSGPQGPKSLCNACGIRQMKARRAMKAAEGLSNGLINTSECKIQKEEEKRSDLDRTVPFKKRLKIVTSASAKKKIQFDDIAISLRNKLAFHQTFPREEKDAAILLMALSGGLIHG